MKSHIELADVSKIYRISNSHRPPGLIEVLRGGENFDSLMDVYALKGITLTVKDGERVGIIGHNGAGKSTLLQVIAKLLQPTKGSVKVSGNVHPIMTMGMGLRQEATGRENIYLDGELQGRSHDESAALEEKIVEFTELESFMDMPVRTYSSGMRARLAFALAITVQPEILIIDEVLSVGDASFNNKAQEKIKRLSEDGQIVLIVSHGMGAIRDMCSRCIWMDNGAVVMDGPADEVTSAYEMEVALQSERELAKSFENDKAQVRNDNSEQTLLDFYVEDLSGQHVGHKLSCDEDYDFVLLVKSNTPLAGEIHFELERLDGIELANNVLPVSVDSTELSGVELRYHMRPLILGIGLYRYNARLLVGDKTIASTDLVLEVSTNRALIGGTPMLSYPSSVEKIDR